MGNLLVETNDESTDAIYCGACNQQLSEAFDAPNTLRRPCPQCGSLSRKFNARIHDELVTKEYLGLKHKRQGKKKPIFEITHKLDLFRVKNSMSEVLRVVDRENDIYTGRITDIETGQVWKDVNEPLSKHQGHGSAKAKKQ